MDLQTSVNLQRYSPFILASGSPRRRELLDGAQARFDVLASGADEPGPEHFPSPQAYVVANAWLKGQSVREQFPLEKRWILSADTVAAKGKSVFGKARDRQDAQRILQTLMGTEHETLTGVCLILPNLDLALTACVTTIVRMKKLTDQQRDDYLDSNQWQGKAGAYAIQIENDRFVEAVEGSFSNVVGLPMERLEKLFASAQELENQG